jgi:SanA protein
VLINSIIIILTPIALVLFLSRLLTSIYAKPRTFQPDDLPAQRIAIVFGAGLWRDGSPSPILRDRVSTAADLYFSGKVEKLLMSGDNRFIDYNEPGAMREYAMELGIPDEAIILDYAGRRTYDTCYRARYIFRLSDAVLVTQQFHLPRAIFTCNMLGINAVGVPADKRNYRMNSMIYWNSRETIATSVALWEVYISKPKPVLGDPQPVFPLEAQ